MSLRYKVWYSAAALAAVSLGMFYTLSHLLVIRGFGAVDRQMAAEDAGQVREAIAAQADALGTIAADWARWDDTYQFMTDRQEAYRESNLTADSLANIRLRAFILVDRAGEPVFAAAVDSVRAEVSALPAEVLDDLRAAGVVRPGREEGISGLVRAAGAVHLVSAYPVVRSDGSGEPAGTLVMLRDFGVAELAQIERLTGVAIDVRSPRDPVLLEHHADVLARLAAQPDALVWPDPADGPSGVTYGLLTDVAGEPCGILRLRETRGVKAIARRTLRGGLLMLIPSVLLAAAGIAWMLERLILARLTRLRGDAGRVSRSLETSACLSVDRDDELGQLAQAMNAMLDSVRESDARYQAVIDNIGVGVALISPRMEVLALNRQMKEWFPRLDVSQHPVCYRAFNHPPREEICEYCPTVRTLQDGQVHESLTETPTDDGIVNYKIVSSALTDRQGRITAAIEMVEDVTASKRVEEALQEEHRNLDAIFESSPVGMLVLDEKARILRANTAAAHLAGVTTTDLTDRRLGVALRCVHSADDPHGCGFGPACCLCPLRKTIEPVISSRVSVRNAEMPFELMREDGVRKLWLSVGAEPLTLSGRPHMIVAIEDISERERAKEDLRKAKDAAEAAAGAKGVFLANMSHEIRTPINGVIGMTHLLLDTALSSTQREYADAIRTSADLLLAVINDILDFSKIEAGRLALHAEDFNLRDVVESVTEPVAVQAQSRGIELAVSVDDSVGTVFHGDPDRLQQILTNLVGNAVKFTAQGEVVISVGPTARKDKQTWFRFDVSDTGIGIAEDVQACLFRPFTQADSSTTRRFGGTGLGLAIARQLVDLMGGTIGVRSVLGKGSVFWFEIPLVPAENVHVGTDLPDSLAGTRVLVVDDNATNRKILLHHVNSWHMRGAAAESGPEALGLLRSAAAEGEPYRLVLLDMQMPGMDGLELARSIKSHPSIAGASLILLSSMGRAVDSEDIRACGIAGMLVKPVKQSKLFDSVVRVLTQSRATTAGDGGARAPEPCSPKIRQAAILLAEDNIINQRVALSQLERLGCSADVVETGVAALAACVSQAYDIVLMDCQMPEMDGYRATEKLRERERMGGGRRCWIIAMTAHAMEGDREKCLAAGMDAYLSKPVLLQDLRHALDQWGASPASGSAPSGSSAPPVDERRLREIAGQDPDRLRNLVDLYFRETLHTLDQIEEAISAGDAQQVERLAHRCAGGSASCGMNAIVQSARSLESRGRLGDLTEARELLGAARRESRRMKEYADGLREMRLESAGKGAP